MDDGTCQVCSHYAITIVCSSSFQNLETQSRRNVLPIPQIMQITKESLKLCNDDVKMWKLTFMRLDYLRMNFLIERLSVERGGESKQKLVDIAREILDMTVFLWLERDRSGHRHYDYDYIVS